MLKSCRFFNILIEQLNKINCLKQALGVKCSPNWFAAAFFFFFFFLFPSSFGTAEPTLYTKVSMSAATWLKISCRENEVDGGCVNK